MTAIYIYPEHINCPSHQSDDWIKLCFRLGYSIKEIPRRLLLIDLKIDE